MYESCKKELRADITDVANFYLLKAPMSNKKIQKLCYYAEAWSRALLDKPIANNAEFEAWVHGSVNVKLYNLFKKYGWRLIEIQPEEDKQIVDQKVNSVFDDDQRDLLESVWVTYGNMTGDQLEAQMHNEAPWIEARDGAKMFERVNTPINTETMVKYYQSIYIGDCA